MVFSSLSKATLRFSYLQRAYEKLIEQGYEIQPEFTREDACKSCVVDEFSGANIAHFYIRPANILLREILPNGPPVDCLRVQQSVQLRDR
jgi:hypothetical protein